MSTYCQYKVRKYKLRCYYARNCVAQQRYLSGFILARREFRTGLLQYSLERYPTFLCLYFSYCTKFTLQVNLQIKFRLILTHLCRKFKNCSNFFKTSYTLPKGWEKNIFVIFFRDMRCYHMVTTGKNGLK